jgi:hypothetical protein
MENMRHRVFSFYEKLRLFYLHSGVQDPCYGSTAKMLGLAAAFLVLDISKDKLKADSGHQPVFLALNS